MRKLLFFLKTMWQKAEPKTITRKLEDKKRPYQVMVDDNFHYMDASERDKQGEYETLEEAIEVCRQITEASIMSFYEPGIEEGALIGQYYTFGEDPWILGSDIQVPFSAWEYAAKRAKELTDNNK